MITLETRCSMPSIILCSKQYENKKYQLEVNIKITGILSTCLELRE